MEHKEISRAFSAIYNDFYLKYRDKGIKKTDEEWEEIVNHADEIVKSFNGEKLVRVMVSGIMDQIEIADKKYGNGALQW